MKLLNDNFFKRTLFGGIFVLLIVGSIYLSCWSFLIVFLLFSALSVREFHIVTNKNAVSVPIWLGVTGAVLMFMWFFITFSGPDNLLVFNLTVVAWLRNFIAFLYVTTILVGFIEEIFRKKPDPVINWAYFILGQLYVALPFALLNGILFTFGWEPLLLLALFVTIWANDTFAYLTGSLFGRHHMAPHVSPHKTWEGFIGGILGSMISISVFACFVTQISLVHWAFFGLIVSVLGTMGDLSESLLKREIGIKDSGNIIPGHGGLLDRFDSMLFVVPMAYVLLMIFY